MGKRADEGILDRKEVNAIRAEIRAEIWQELIKEWKERAENMAATISSVEKHLMALNALQHVYPESWMYTDWMVEKEGEQ